MLLKFGAVGVEMTIPAAGKYFMTSNGMIIKRLYDMNPLEFESLQACNFPTQYNPTNTHNGNTKSPLKNTV